ncbi:MAG: hypothetical protein J5644_00875 [Bacteroidales bacterium]|nr:hypothetical protein [Bacteroidales bacterium]
MNDKEILIEKGTMLPYAVKSFIFACISLGFSWVPFFGIGSIVVGFLGMKYSKSAMVENEEHPGIYRGVGFARVGNRCSKIGVIVSSAMTVFWILCVGCIIAVCFGDSH